MAIKRVLEFGITMLAGGNRAAQDTLFGSLVSDPDNMFLQKLESFLELRFKVLEQNLKNVRFDQIRMYIDGDNN